MWYQFTLAYPRALNKQFPLGVLLSFLPAFKADTFGLVTRWHYLFEPSCLVRFQSSNPERVWEIAQSLAQRDGLEIHRGDTANSSPSQQAGWTYEGEEEFYGVELWERNADWLHATAALSLAINQEDAARQIVLAKKHVHLLLNALGFNWAEEGVILADRSSAATGAFIEHGRV